MDITPYVESLRHDLAAAAEAGGPEAKAAAERLALALDPAVRLALMDALSQAAAEITAELPSRLASTSGSAAASPSSWSTYPPCRAGRRPPPAPPTPPSRRGRRGGEDDALARITLRIPESVKYKAEELAAKGGHSLNSWIVNVVRAATRERAPSTSTSTSRASRSSTARASRPGRGRGSKRMTGWI